MLKILWVLVITSGVGRGPVTHIYFDSESHCFSALEAIKTARQLTVSFCFPGAVIPFHKED